MASIVVSGDTSGTITLSAPLVAGSNTATLPLATGELSMLGGAGQTWTDVTASRALDTTYTNSTGKPIQVFIQINLASNSIATFAINGITFSIGANSGAGTTITTLSFIVPNENTYIFTGTISKWAELR
jgi:hypothetical protein